MTSIVLPLHVAGPARPTRVALSQYLPALRASIAKVLGPRVGVSVAVAAGTASVWVDPGALEQILTHLAHKARDAMPAGGHFWLHACNADADDRAGLPSGSYTVLIASNTGSGLDETVTALVAPPARRDEGPLGVDDGMAQLRGFCREAHGSVQSISTPGLGTTVSLVLPATEH